MSKGKRLGVYIYIYIHMYVQIYVCVCIYIYICIYMCVCVCVCIHKHTQFLQENIRCLGNKLAITYFIEVYQIFSHHVVQFFMNSKLLALLFLFVVWFLHFFGWDPGVWKFLGPGIQPIPQQRPAAVTMFDPYCKTGMSFNKFCHCCIKLFHLLDQPFDAVAHSNTILRVSNFYCFPYAVFNHVVYEERCGSGRGGIEV